MNTPTVSRSPSNTVPKAALKVRALETLRRVQGTGDSVFITDRGRPVLRLAPADRLIVASAERPGATLVTKDERLCAYPGDPTLWD